MKKILFALILLLHVVVSSASGEPGELLRKAIYNLAEKAVSDMPSEPKQNLAIRPITDDVNSLLTQALHESIVKAGNYKVIEREELSAILEEQGRMLSDIFEESAGEKLGKIEGVELLLIGTLLHTVEKNHKATSRALLKILDVESGEIVWQAEITGSEASGLRKALIWGIGGVIILGFAIFIFKQLVAAGRYAMQSHADSKREKIKSLLGKTSQELDNVIALLPDEELRELCHEIRREVSFVQEKITSASYGDSADAKLREKEEHLALDVEALYQHVAHISRQLSVEGELIQKLEIQELKENIVDIRLSLDDV